MSQQLLRWIQNSARSCIMTEGKKALVTFERVFLFGRNFHPDLVWILGGEYCVARDA
jgi:hypothetical protein